MRRQSQSIASQSITSQILNSSRGARRPRGQSRADALRYIISEAKRLRDLRVSRCSRAQSRSTVSQHITSEALEGPSGRSQSTMSQHIALEAPNLQRGSGYLLGSGSRRGRSRSILSQHSAPESPNPQRGRARTRYHPFRGKHYHEPIAPHLRADYIPESPVRPASPTFQPEAATSDSALGPQATAGLCDENPVFFWGTTDIVQACNEMESSPPLHCLPALACQNTNAHPEKPHLVCRACHQRADKHIRLTNPGLLTQKYVPICQACKNFWTASRPESDGRVEGCVCFTNANGDNWLCFDCRETSLMFAQARWEAENEIYPNDVRLRIWPLCRCGALLRKFGETVSYFQCVGCDGIKEMAVEGLNATEKKTATDPEMPGSRIQSSKGVNP